MNAMNARPGRTPNFSPSFVPALPESDDLGPERPEVVPSTSRMAGKIRGLVARHPEETLSVLRNWMVETSRGG